MDLLFLSSVPETDPLYYASPGISQAQSSETDIHSKLYQIAHSSMYRSRKQLDGINAMLGAVYRTKLPG